MTDPDLPATPERLAALLEDGALEVAGACLERLRGADRDTRKRALRAVRDVAEAHPERVAELVGTLAGFLTDDDRAVRLTAAKLFVEIAATDSGAVSPAVDSLADRLADEAEFYYVRARCAEALGYVALDSPAAVSDPGLLADLRVGLSFDEPEVRVKLAKALAYVAMGDPSRLRHHVSTLAAHLDDDSDRVRYHASTALVVVGCEHPGRLAPVAADLRERLADESPYVRGRAAEALAVLVESNQGTESAVSAEDLLSVPDDSQPFLSRRVAFLRRTVESTGRDTSALDGVGSVESVRRGNEAAIESMTSRSGMTCSQCGLERPDAEPPSCPRCGAPY